MASPLLPQKEVSAVCVAMCLVKGRRDCAGRSERAQHRRKMNIRGFCFIHKNIQSAGCYT